MEEKDDGDDDGDEEEEEERTTKQMGKKIKMNERAPYTCRQTPVRPLPASVVLDTSFD